MARHPITAANKWPEKDSLLRDDTIFILVVGRSRKSRMYDIPKTKYECLEALRINVDVMWTVNYDELVGEEIDDEIPNPVE